ncbi:hypothetical protein K435DRAFT_967427 [Dendrothele bispora CBS 962.96]|uniref:F-box domain-containing protein n=1 Tax=Dendrothele bispora (strain CBS 962.96) TaxID=1314807 RepID=A0A4S8LUF2_DENBC|nr:hypothetical protein K435DRAFT_967427 [Dendrothele bispora CBS 962.96]
MVCKQWSNVSLDIRWHEVSDLRAFFNLLAPVGVDDDIMKKKTCYIFLVDPKPQDWIRFEEKYCWRVRHLNLTVDSCSDETTDHIATLLSRVAHIRSCQPILPNLTKITYEGKLSRGLSEYATLFMHGNVSEAHIDQIEERDCDGFLQVIRTRMPNLTHLDLHIFPAPQNLTSVNGLVAALPCLQSLIVPAFPDVSPVLRALPDPTKLSTFKADYYTEEMITLSVVPLSILLSLNVLSISTRFQYLTASFQDMLMSQLTTISSMTDIIESPADVMQLLSALMQACPKLSSLLLEFDLDIQVPPVVSESRIQMEHLTPLLTCSTLTQFSFRHPYMLALDNEDIERITSHLPLLEILVLNPTLTEASPKPTALLTLEVLLSFARHCPRIREIGLFLQAVITSQEELLAKFPSNPFPRLRFLDVGDSYIANPISVASFLGEILPLDAQVEYSCDQWKQVEDLLPMSLEKAFQARRKIDVLEKRIRELESGAPRN